MLAPTAQAPAGGAVRGRIVCSCHGVGEVAIAQALQAAVGDAATKLEAVQRTLRCGTECGSCLPELRKLSASAMKAA